MSSKRIHHMNFSDRRYYLEVVVKLQCSVGFPVISKSFQLYTQQRGQGLDT